MKFPLILWLIFLLTLELLFRRADPPLALSVNGIFTWQGLILHWRFVKIRVSTINIVGLFGINGVNINYKIIPLDH